MVEKISQNIMAILKAWTFEELADFIVVFGHYFIEKLAINIYLKSKTPPKSIIKT
jgi:hypothetical protein